MTGLRRIRRTALIQRNRSRQHASLTAIEDCEIAPDSTSNDETPPSSLALDNVVYENAIPASRTQALTGIEMREKWAGANSNRGYGHPKAEGYQATPPARDCS